MDTKYVRDFDSYLYEFLYLSSHPGLKKSNNRAGENSMQKKKMLSRIKVMMFYIYMLFGYMIGLLLMMYICDVSKANDVTAVNIDVAYSTCSVAFRCLDVYLIIIIVRSLEMKPYSATLPCFCPERPT